MGTLYLVTGGLDSWGEAKERAAEKTGWQKAEVGDIRIEVSISVEAIANNWNRVINRLNSEIDTPYPNQTFYLQRVIDPCPAYDGWTIFLEFESVEDMNQNLERLRKKVERICNDRRR